MTHGIAWLGRQVVGVYEGRQWAFILEHLHDVLGKQSKAVGDLHGAVRHFLAMLPCPRSAPSWQAFYLRQFLDAATQLAASSEVPIQLQPMLAAITYCHCLHLQHATIPVLITESNMPHMSGCTLADWILLLRKHRNAVQAQSGHEGLYTATKGVPMAVQLILCRLAKCDLVN